MAHIPLDPSHLRLRDPLPFGVYDSNGMLLLPAGGVIAAEDKLELLRSKQLLIDEGESARWRDTFSTSVGRLIFDNARLEQIAVGRMDARPASPRPRPGLDASATGKTSLVESWEKIVRALSMNLRDAARDPRWLERLMGHYEQARLFADKRRDLAYFLLIQHTIHGQDHYCAHHALLCALVCSATARALGWTAEEAQTIGLAAITMNAAMAQLQDSLVQQRTPLTLLQREQIDQHGTLGASLLASAGVNDPRWLKIVRLHHDRSLESRPLREMDAASRMARLLGIVDRFTAKISRRTGRTAMSPLAAARDACVGPDGQPDDLGSGVLKVLGMYPPGIYVTLANSEQAVVVKRGSKANEPVVASFVGSSGLPLSPPVIRDTSAQGRAVAGVLPSTDVRVRLNHEQIVAQL